jgi:hypothetical protein
MVTTLYNKIKEVKDKFNEYYGKDIYESISEKEGNMFYEINLLLLDLLSDIEMEDEIEEDE